MNTSCHDSNDIAVYDPRSLGFATLAHSLEVMFSEFYSHASVEYPLQFLASIGASVGSANLLQWSAIV